MSEDMKQESCHEVEKEIEDGGGCIEAWEAMNNVRDSEADSGNPDRRAVIKLLGAGAASVAGMGTASANDQTSDSEPIQEEAGARRQHGNGEAKTEFDPQELAGSEARKAISTAISSRDYNDLVQQIQRAEEYVPKVGEATVLRVTDEEDVPHEIVSFPLAKLGKEAHGSENKETRADMAITLRNGQVVNSKGVVLESGAVPEKQMAAESTGTTEIPITTRAYTATEDGIQTSSRKAVIEEGPATENEVSTQGKSAECWSCQIVGNAACTVGCGLGVAAICAGTAVANLAAGMGCTVVAGAVCLVLTSGAERYVGASCLGDIHIEWACYHAGYCDDAVNPTA